MSLFLTVGLLGLSIIVLGRDMWVTWEQLTAPASPTIDLVAVPLSNVVVDSTSRLQVAALDLSAAEQISRIASTIVLSALGATFTLTAVMLLRWVHGAWRDALDRGVPMPSWTPAWAVIWWFMPFVNLWMPISVMAALWYAARVDPHAAESSAGDYAPWTVNLWWWVFVFATVVAGVGLGLRNLANSLIEVGDALDPAVFENVDAVELVRIYTLIADGALIAAFAAYLASAGFLVVVLNQITSGSRWQTPPSRPNVPHAYEAL